MNLLRASRRILLLAIVGSVGCGFSASDRADGTRAPRTSVCGDPEEIRCLLPWPSDDFTRRDDTAPTGLRVEVQRQALPVDDDPAPLLRADGFSRVTPLLFGVRGTLDAGGLEGAVHLLEGPTGRSIPLHVRVHIHEEESLVVLWPRWPLAADTEHVVAVGDAVPATRASLLALDRLEPASQADAELIAHHAPTRRTLARAGLEAAQLSRAWAFTTRSRRDATERLLSMRARSIKAAQAAQIAIDDVQLHDDTRSLTVEGRLLAMPLFAPSKSAWTLGEDGLPKEVGRADVNFRVVLPNGDGDYGVSMYGHGTSGDFRDVAFDVDMAGLGLAKVATTLHGWSGPDVFDTFMAMARMFEGIELSTSRLAQGLADTAALQEALSGTLGEVLSAPKLGGVPNPAAGRRADVSAPVWTGGSMGGSVGAVYALIDESIKTAVLNVSGAGWTHFVSESVLFELLASALSADYDTPLDLHLSLAMSQALFDDVDAAVWADAVDRPAPVCLLQQSMGDPVLPNQGTELLAAALGARQVGQVLAAVPGLEAVAGPLEGQSGLTQFRVPGEGMLDIHGFAARETIAGEAARWQIRTFIESALAGAPRIELPASCVDGRCDFAP